VNVNLVHGTLHYLVVMTKEGNIRIKDSYWDAKHVSDFYWQHLRHINDELNSSCPCEQILLDLIDQILEDRMQAEIKQEKLKKQRASRALLAERA
jgi:hypothetical protein